MYMTNEHFYADNLCNSFFAFVSHYGTMQFIGPGPSSIPVCIGKLGVYTEPSQGSWLVARLATSVFVTPYSAAAATYFNSICPCGITHPSSH